MSERSKLYRHLHAILAKKGLRDEKQQLIEHWTGGRTSSLSEMSEGELRGLIRKLGGKVAPQPKALGPPLRHMRAKVVAILCSLDYLTPQGDPDYERINAWCCSRTRAAKPLLDQSYEELLHTVNTAEQYQESIQQ